MKRRKQRNPISILTFIVLRTRVVMLAFYPLLIGRPIAFKTATMITMKCTTTIYERLASEATSASQMKSASSTHRFREDGTVQNANRWTVSAYRSVIRLGILAFFYMHKDRLFAQCKDTQEYSHCQEHYLMKVDMRKGICKSYRSAHCHCKGKK